MKAKIGSSLSQERMLQSAKKRKPEEENVLVTAKSALCT